MSDIYTIIRRKDNQIIWQDGQQEKIIESYNQGKSLAEICNIFNIKAPETIRRVLKKNGVKVVGFRNKFPLNENYFENIDSNEKAYWLGMLYADGNISNYDNEVALSLKDKEHVEKFKEAIGAINHHIIHIVDNRWKSKCHIYKVYFKCSKLKQDLIKWGCIPNKSQQIVSIPNIKQEYFSHFIRGYFDGDGSIHIGNKNNYRISFVGTYDFLKEIQHVLNVSTKIVQNGGTNNKSFVFQVMGNQQIYHIMNYLYTDATYSTVLIRKYNKYQDLCSVLGASPLNLEI